ncbi:hypothetical protein SKAU_G00005830 [Synaphobranchus kaupii]|uniref:Uncharacterized protein n=1 Tax=Synaphobranchus kaupii TaxID=118154 RepID=A0A9Q1G927_SYNKA|nr:hypothetical protein SKAU_G00005830 [Synaphobranchus kaupii]
MLWLLANLHRNPASICWDRRLDHRNCDKCQIQDCEVPVLLYPPTVSEDLPDTDELLKRTDERVYPSATMPESDNLAEYGQDSLPRLLCD